MSWERTIRATSPATRPGALIKFYLYIPFLRRLMFLARSSSFWSGDGTVFDPVSIASPFASFVACSEGWVPFYWEIEVSALCFSCHITSRHVMSRWFVFSHPLSSRVMSRHVMSRRKSGLSDITFANKPDMLGRLVKQVGGRKKGVRRR